MCVYTNKISRESRDVIIIYVQTCRHDFDLILYKVTFEWACTPLKFMCSYAFIHNEPLNYYK